MHRIAWTVVAICALGAGASAEVVDQYGVVLIDQYHALVGGIGAGDSSGFPITISNSGTYKLISNLTVSSKNTTAIQISADNVTLDLNGFTILGPIVCTADVGTSYLQGCTANDGLGAGISVSGLGVKISNGIIRGMGAQGIFITDYGRADVESVRLLSNGDAGIQNGGKVNGCTAILNGGAGMTGLIITNSIASQNRTNGIAVYGSGNGNTSFLNKGTGIAVLNGSLVNSTTYRNQGNGIDAFCPSSLVGNTSYSNVPVNIATTGAGCVQANNASN